MAAALSLSAAAATAADAPTTLQGVTVQPQAGRAVVQRRVDAFVRGMTSLSVNQSLRTWRTPVCPLVAAWRATRPRPCSCGCRRWRPPPARRWRRSAAGPTCS